MKAWRDNEACYISIYVACVTGMVLSSLAFLGSWQAFTGILQESSMVVGAIWIGAYFYTVLLLGPAVLGYAAFRIWTRRFGLRVARLSPCCQMTIMFAITSIGLAPVCAMTGFDSYCVLELFVPAFFSSIAVCAI